MIRIDFFDDEELAEMVKLVRERLETLFDEKPPLDEYFDGLSLLNKLEREQQRRKEIADGESETCNIL